MPQLCWFKAGERVMPVEDPIQAAEYERLLKARPSPFVTQVKFNLQNPNEIEMVRVGLNVPTLLHRALARLPLADHSEHPIPHLSWRLDIDYNPILNFNLPKFVLLNNKHDKEHAQPPHFRVPLRREQLHSLEWMERQELDDVEQFIEEEISEALLSPLGWRAEGRAQRHVKVKGGVLADEVGYGKTAIVLGLIDYTHESIMKEFVSMRCIPGKISVKATLIIVPPHLVRQWSSEVEKFIGNGRFKVIILISISDLDNLTIADIQAADIIIVGSNIFRSRVYLDNLELFAAAGELPATSGRYFDAQLEKSLDHLGKQVDRLQEKGSQVTYAAMEGGLKRGESS
ncbi:DNA repair protein RAD5 [Leucoagaricus sp. SymC.cos]|nr:DNA repair protein RAD5 [Leucoagaricus sp. SymC.cos]